MPRAVKNVDVTHDDSKFVNSVVSAMRPEFRSMLGIAETQADVKEIGGIVMSYPGMANDFVSVLMNRIFSVVITSKTYQNPLAMFKRGELMYGETVEEVFVNICQAHNYDPEVAEKEVFKTEKPDIRSAFHSLNYEKFYKQTLIRAWLEQAFLNEGGMYDLTEKVVTSMVTSENYDEFLVMKYMMARAIINGEFKAVQVPAMAEENAKSIVRTIKSVSNKLTFLNSNYNYANVETHTDKNNQFIIVNSDWDAMMDVDVLAAAFNMSKAEFLGHRVLLDSFGDLDTERLDALLGDTPGYVKLSSDQISKLNSIPGVIIDRDWFFVMTKPVIMKEMENPQSLAWNYWRHAWKMFSVSPFANAVLFVPGKPSITSVTVSPGTANASVGQTLQFSAKVVTENFADQRVEWSSNNDKVKIDKTGLAIVGTGATGQVKITATSKYDKSKKGEATITIA